METEDIWVAGKITDNSDPKRVAWRLIGIYTEEAKAVKACTSKNDFVRPFALNVRVEDLGKRLKEIRFPLREKK